MDAIELLTNDHREVERLFAQLGDEGADQHHILGQIVRQLAMHDAVEKRVLYPEVEQYVPGGRVLAERALAEHDEADQLLASVDGRDPSDPEVARQLDLLMAAVRRHVSEEESEIFPALMRASEPGQLVRLGTKLESAMAWAPTHPHPHAPVSGPLAGPLNAAASVVDMARDNFAGSSDTAVMESVKGEDKAPLANPSAGDKPPVDLMSWPDVYRDEETRQALSSAKSSPPAPPGKPATAAEAAAPGSTAPRSPATEEPSPSEASVAELVRQVAEQTAQLARQELALARMEVRQTGRRAGLGLGALSLAGVVGLLGGGALVAGIILLVAIPLAGWAAALIVGGGMSVLAALIALAGAGQVRRAIRPPSASVLDRVKADLDAVKDGVAATKGST